MARVIEYSGSRIIALDVSSQFLFLHITRCHNARYTHQIGVFDNVRLDKAKQLAMLSRNLKSYRSSSIQETHHDVTT